MEEEMSTYTFIIESEVCNTGFEMVWDFFLRSSQSKVVCSGALLLCSVHCDKAWDTWHPPSRLPFTCCRFLPLSFSRTYEEAKWEWLPWNRAEVALAPFGTGSAVPVCNVGRGEDACVVSHLSFASVTSAAVWTNLCESWRKIVGCFCQEPHCSQRGTNEASAFGDSASELGSKYKLDKNTGALSSANYHKLPTWAVLRESTCSYLKLIYKLAI